MSRRTSEANKAIATAWSNEKQLVQEGKGTRDWTPEQQHDILDRGKAYDDNGKAFEGHHMKSAEEFPEYQGDSENIQFLSRSEHFAAHNGNFQTPTNGYYDPYTGKTRDFGANKYEPCKVIELNEPVIDINSKGIHVEENSEKSVGSIKKDDVATGDTEGKRSISTTKLKADSFDASKSQKTKQPLSNKSGNEFMQSIGKGVKSVFKSVIKFAAKHPEVVIGFGLKVIGAASGNFKASANGDDRHIIQEDFPSDEDTFDRDGRVSESSEETSRTSPCEHSVSGYDRQQNGKTVHVRSYTRGKNTDG